MMNGDQTAQAMCLRVLTQSCEQIVFHAASGVDKAVYSIECGLPPEELMLLVAELIHVGQRRQLRPVTLYRTPHDLPVSAGVQPRGNAPFGKRCPHARLAVDRHAERAAHQRADPIGEVFRIDLPVELGNAM